MIERHTARICDGNNIVEFEKVLIVDAEEEFFEVLIDRKTTISFIKEFLPIAIKDICKDDYNNDTIFANIITALADIIKSNKETTSIANINLRCWRD